MSLSLSVLPLCLLLSPPLFTRMSYTDVFITHSDWKQNTTNTYSSAHWTHSWTGLQWLQLPASPPPQTRRQHHQHPFLFHSCRGRHCSGVGCQGEAAGCLFKQQCLSSMQFSSLEGLNTHTHTHTCPVVHHASRVVRHVGRSGVKA